LAYIDNSGWAIAVHNIRHFLLLQGLSFEKLDQLIHPLGHFINTTFHGSHGHSGLLNDKKLEITLLISEGFGVIGKLP